MDTLDSAEINPVICWLAGRGYNVAKSFLPADLLFTVAGILEKNNGGVTPGWTCYYAYLWRNYAAYWSVQYKTKLPSGKDP